MNVIGRLIEPSPQGFFRSAKFFLAACLSTFAGVPAVADEAGREGEYLRYLGLPSLVKGGYVQAHWLEDGNRFWYQTVFPEAQTVLVDPVAGTRTAGFEPSAGDGQASWKPRAVRRSRWMFDLFEILSPDGKRVASLQDHDVWLREQEGPGAEPLTEGGTQDWYWADDEQPWAWWSPDGATLATKKVDSRSVPRIAIGSIDSDKDIEWLRFAAAGEPLQRAELFFIDVSSGTQTRLDTGPDPEAQIHVLGWNDDGSELLFLTLDRFQKTLVLGAANRKTGAVRAILSERRDTFFPGFWARPPYYYPLSGGRRFLWLSERSGWSQLYLHDHEGQMLQQITTGAFPVHDVVQVDENGGWVYLRAHGDRDRPYDTHLYRVQLDGSGGMDRLTEGPGMHEIRMSPSGDYFLDSHSAMDRPPQVDLRTADGTLLMTLARGDTSDLDERPATAPEPITALASDGKTRLYGVLYKPSNFDPNARYPVIEYIYDGHWTTLVPRHFSQAPGYPDPNEWFPLDSVDPRALAQLGFIVMLLDGRGTPHRGREFQAFSYRRDPEVVIEDHAGALRQVAEERPWMDLARVGVFGISEGGYFTLRAMLSAPKVYHVGVALSPTVDHLSISAGGVEPFYGHPREQPELYAHLSLPPLAARLEGQLLMIHGTRDRIVPVAHTLRMSAALIEAGRQHEIVLLPGQDHVYSGANARYAREATRQFFEKHLGNPRSATE